MYQSDLKPRDKGGAAVAVVAVHAGLALALLHLSGTVNLADTQRVLRVFDVTEIPPPPTPPPPPMLEKQRETQKAKEKEGAASPKNIRSEATPVVAPKPAIPLPVPPKIAVTETPRQGAAPTQGASDVHGPGTGAGGTGTGTGSGGAGSGTGGGGGGVAAGPALIRGITNRDYPDAIQRRWPRGGRIFLRLRIEPNGRPSRCDVMRGYGDSAADQWTCSLVMQRAMFRPAVDARGVPVAAWFGYVQSETGRFER